MIVWVTVRFEHWATPSRWSFEVHALRQTDECILALTPHVSEHQALFHWIMSESRTSVFYVRIIYRTPKVSCWQHSLFPLQLWDRSTGNVISISQMPRILHHCLVTSIGLLPHSSVFKLHQAFFRISWVFATHQQPTKVYLNIWFFVCFLYCLENMTVRFHCLYTREGKEGASSLLVK